MKKIVTSIILGSMLAVLVVGFSGCGPGAEEILKNSINSSKKIKTVHFEFESEMQMPRAPIVEGKVQKQNFVYKSSGDYDNRTGDYRSKTSIEGRPIEVLQVGEKQYWKIAGHWYDVPEAARISPPVTASLSMSQYIKYFKNIEKLGDTEIDGESCYHIEAIPDMKEFVKQPGLTDLLKDPSGEQVRTIDELEEIQAVFHFYIRKKDNYFKRYAGEVKARADAGLIKLGYAEAGDKIEMGQMLTYGNYDERLDLMPPSDVSPLPAK